MSSLMTFRIAPLKQQKDQVSGQVQHIFDPAGEVSEFGISANHIVSVRPFDVENNVYEIQFEIGTSYRPVMVIGDSVEELCKGINIFCQNN